VVRGDVALVGALEQREVGDPQELPRRLAGLGHEVEAVAQLEAQGVERLVGDVEVVGDDQQHRAGPVAPACAR
jgi:hypothetical protein